MGSVFEEMKVCNYEKEVFQMMDNKFYLKQSDDPGTAQYSISQVPVSSSTDFQKDLKILYLPHGWSERFDQ